ncbi:MAG: ABC transporter ATP-binding protein [Bacteroidales bacterium]|jgi:iron complex transport system ATP-binding protein|nr:ABC transporter ATP-binding protein [Bacteroidales bacterium]
MENSIKNINNILDISNLEIGYPNSSNGNKSIFSNINLSAHKGELIALIGQNGIGKSTLLRNISGLQKAISGNVKLYDKNINQYHRSDFAQKISFVSTDIVKVANLKVFDLVALGRFPHTNWFGKIREIDKYKIENALELVGMSSYRNKNITEISDGERQRVMIARTIAQDTEIIVFDEPTAFLDLPNKYEIVHLLNSLSKKENKTIIFSSHDLNIAIQEADKIWLMLDNIIHEGAPEDLIINKIFDKMFESSKLYFDKDNGDFKINRKTNKQVGLVAKNNNLLVWTKKALERMHIFVEENNTEIPYIEVVNNKWIYKDSENNNEFNSIYNLSLHLKSIN